MFNCSTDAELWMHGPYMQVPQGGVSVTCWTQDPNEVVWCQLAKSPKLPVQIEKGILNHLSNKWFQNQNSLYTDTCGVFSGTSRRSIGWLTMFWGWPFLYKALSISPWALSPQESSCCRACSSTTSSGSSVLQSWFQW